MSSTLRMPKGSLQAVKRLQNLAQTRHYTTENVLKLRGATVDKTKTLYNAADETENCGVGLIANMKSIPSRHVVEVADEMLVRMAHRGGCGCDPNSGDGAGEYIEIYHARYYYYFCEIDPSFRRSKFLLSR